MQFPRRLKFVEQLLEDIDSRHCSRPVYLARGVSTYGVSEARGCTLVLEAMEKGIITQCDEHEPSIEDMEFREFFEKNGKGEEWRKSPRLQIRVDKIQIWIPLPPWLLLELELSRVLCSLQSSKAWVKGL